MSAVEVIFGIVLLIFAIAIIAVVLLQEGQQPTGAMQTGNTETFYQKNKSRTVDAFLARCTTVISVGFAITVIVMNVVTYFAK